MSPDPVALWQYASFFWKELPLIGLRLAQTPANSVLAERSFSAMNLICSKTRNRLSFETMTKLMFTGPVTCAKVARSDQ